MLSHLHQPIYENRITVLSELISDHVQTGDRILDIGSGGGALAHRILQRCKELGKEIQIHGLEKHARGNEQIPTESFDGDTIPYEDNHYDAVILADVVHHEENYMRLLEEATRVTSRLLILKDHVPTGFLGYQRICLMDWAANNPYGVKCLYRYFTANEWREIFEKLGLKSKKELTSIKLYQEPFNFIFGNRLQYLAVLSK